MLSKYKLNQLYFKDTQFAKKIRLLIDYFSVILFLVRHCLFRYFHLFLFS